MYIQRSNLFIINCFFYFVLFPCFIFSLASRSDVKSGDVSINKKSDGLIINQKSNKAIIHWQDFSIEKKESIRFEQPSSSSSILNRVVGTNPSQIYGQIDANGKVYLINQNGILVGKDAIINTKDFIASTLNIEDKKYLSENELCFFQEKESSLVNEGKITSLEGNILLISPEIKNNGELIAENGSVILLAGNEGSYNENENAIGIKINGKGFIDQKGKIKALSTKLKEASNNIYSLAINQDEIDANIAKVQGGHIFLSADTGEVHLSGHLQATYEEKGGKIEIFADKVHIQKDAILDVSEKLGGGEILIGDPNKDRMPINVYIEKGASFQADAIEEGDGGNVTIFAEKVNAFHGTVNAKGGNVKGNGGIVEVSAKEDLQFHGFVFTTAINGKTGKLKLDPSDITIGDYGGTSTPAFPTGGPGTYSPTSSIATLDYLDVQNALATNNVTISTAGGSGGTGSINVEHGITWNAATTLELIADRHIEISSVTISNTHSGTGDWTAMDFQANQAATTSGNFSGIKLLNGTLSSNEGHISLLGKGGNTDHYNVGIFIDSNSNILSTGTGTNPANITLNGTGGPGVYENQGIRISGTSLIQTTEGAITLTGVSNGSDVNNYGIYIRNGSTVQSTGTGTEIGGLTINGTGTGSQNNPGVNIAQETTITSISADIDITGVSNGTGTYNPGIKLSYGGVVISTGTGTSAALVTLDGTSGTGSQENQGVEVYTDSKISSVDGDIHIKAESRGKEDYCHGFALKEYSEILSLGDQNDAATITIDGIAGGGSVDNFGAYKDETSRIYSERGDVTITGGTNM